MNFMDDPKKNSDGWLKEQLTGRSFSQPLSLVEKLEELRSFIAEYPKHPDIDFLMEYYDKTRAEVERLQATIAERRRKP